MAMSTDVLVENSLNKFITLTQNPEEFLSTRETLFKKFKDTTKDVYDISKTTEHRKNRDQALPELIVENFDEEQVWQEIELQNDSIITELVLNIAGLTSAKLPVTFCQLKSRKEREKLNEEKKSKKVKFDSIEESSSDNKDESDEKSESKESGDDTDNELDSIKSRLLMTGEDSDDDNDADFDIGALSEAFKDVDEEEEDSENDDENQEAENTFNDHNEFSADKQTSRKRKKKSVVDDKFFKLADMEEFLIQEDNKFEKQRKNDMKTTKHKTEESDEEDDDEIDMFEAFPSDEDDEQSKNARYEDFFDPPDDDDLQITSKSVDDQKVASDEEDDDSSEEDDSGHESSESVEDEVGGKERQNLLGDSDSEGEDVANILGGARREKKSTFEKRQEKLKEKIAKMEEASLEQKSWQLTGESSSQDRPENSLLEEHLDFENIAQLPPVITETTTHDLEQMIKQRIKDKAFNDVKRVIKPWEDPYEYKKRTELSHEKSNQSLSQIYEQAYNKQKHKEDRIMEDPAHKKIEKKLQSLFVKLDALSNFHYTPKPAAPDVKIVSNLPSIAMEEVAPVSVSDSKLLAPEEVKEKIKGGIVISAREKSSTDRKRDKRKKKADKKKRIKAQEEKMAILRKKHPELKDKLDKTKAKKKLQKNSRVTLLKSHEKRERAMLSSKKFFTQLQEEVCTNQKAKAADKRKSSNTSGKSAKQFKL